MNSDNNTNRASYNFSKIFSLIILVIIIFFGVGFFLYESENSCQKTLYYDFGSFNSEFDISKADLVKTTKDAESVWEKPFNHNFFEYKPGSKFKINLIYDSRQKTSNERKKLDGLIEGQKGTLKDLQSSYDDKLSNYNSQLSKYNAEVYKWNSQGGAPPDVFSNLSSEKNTLDTQRNAVNNLGDVIKNKAQEVNNQVSQYNERAGQTFHKGEYDGKEIDVYEFQGANELELALAHEFGHVLNLRFGPNLDQDHDTNNPKAIMNPYLQDQDLTDVSATKDDINALKEVCSQGRWQTFLSNFRN